MKDLINRKYYERTMDKIAEGENNSIVLSGKNTPLFCMGFSGRSDKPRFYYSFSSIERRDKYINEFLKNQKLIVERKAKEKEELKNKIHSAKVGDIFYTSWGYDQTNINFYEVIEVKTEKSVVFQEICSNIIETGFMCGESTPIKGHFRKNSVPFTARVNKWGGFSHKDDSLLTHKEGEKHYCSWYA